MKESSSVQAAATKSRPLGCCKQHVYFSWCWRCTCEIRVAAWAGSGESPFLLQTADFLLSSRGSEQRGGADSPGLGWALAGS